MRPRHRRRIADHAVFSKRRNIFHIFVGNGKAENIAVVLNPLGRCRFRHRHRAFLENPANAKLRHAHTVFFGGFDKQFALKRLPLNQRAPRFGENFVFFAVIVTSSIFFGSGRNLIKRLFFD